MCKSIILSVIAVTCLAALLATDRMAFAQAGSTGGTIGKTGKSATGENGDTDEPHTKRPPGNRHVEHATRSFTGRWDWESSCAGVRYSGGFQLTEGPGGRLTGEFHDSQGGQIDGSVHGNEASFIRPNLACKDGVRRWSHPGR